MTAVRVWILFLSHSFTPSAKQQCWGPLRNFNDISNTPSSTPTTASKNSRKAFRGAGGVQTSTGIVAPMGTSAPITTESQSQEVANATLERWRSEAVSRVRSRAGALYHSEIEVIHGLFVDDAGGTLTQAHNEKN